MEEQKSTLVEYLARALEIKALLDAQKPLYDELDKITAAVSSHAILREQAEQNGSSIAVKEHGHYFTLVDNFAVKNTVFRPAAVRRFEVKIQTEEEVAYSLMSKSEKTAFNKAKKAKETATNAVVS